MVQPLPKLQGGCAHKWQLAAAPLGGTKFAQTRLRSPFTGVNNELKGKVIFKTHNKPLAQQYGALLKAITIHAGSTATMGGRHGGWQRGNIVPPRWHRLT